MFILWLLILQFEKEKPEQTFTAIIKSVNLKSRISSEEIPRVRDKIWTFLSIPLIGYKHWNKL